MELIILAEVVFVVAVYFLFIRVRTDPRVKELAERYETPLPCMVSRVTDLEEKVNRHLERMGFSWK